MGVDIKNTLRGLGLSDLPDGKKIVREGIEMSKDVAIGTSLFMEKYGVSSEREYKERRMKEHEVMFMFQYGLTDFETSEEGLHHIYDEVTKRGHRVDRHGFVLDRVMGLPEEMRNLVPKETGLKLNSKEEWKALGRIVPIQPHMGDHIISSPASVENLVNALSAGITTVGNFSQYFTYEYPMWNDHILRTTNFIKALGIMAGLRDRGVMLHSNIDDGFGSQFYDRCSNIGWAMIEYYIINDLVGAKLAPCFGNLVDDPLTRMSTILCLDDIHKHECVGSMIYGDTITPGTDLTRNLASTASYVINDIVMQMHTPTGHAVTPCPTSEAVRIPTPDEILQVQMLGAQLRNEAARQYEITDFTKIEARASLMLEQGRKFCNRILDAFSDVIDVEDPFKLVCGLRALGADNLENMFADDKPNTGLATERKPSIPTGMYTMVTSMIDDTLNKVIFTDDCAKKLNGKKALIASMDVHQYGKMIVHAMLKKAGMEVKDAGNNADTACIITNIKAEKPDVVVLSTYNGQALSLSKELIAQAKKEGVWGSVPVIIGGRLNDDSGREVPVDVTEDLREMGLYPSETIEGMPELLGQIL